MAFLGNMTSRFGDDNLQLIDFSNEDDYLIAFPYRDSVVDLRLSVSFDNNEHVQFQSNSVDQRRKSFLRKSIAWDSAFFNSAGLLNHEELFIINKGLKNTESNQPYHTTQKNGERSSQSYELSCKKMICPQNKVKSGRTLKSQSLNPWGTNGVVKTRITNHQVMQENNNAALEGSDHGKMEQKTRKAITAQDLTVSKRSRWGDLSGLPKSTSFTSPKSENKLKVHSSYESSSTAFSSKSIKRKVNSNKMKLVNSPSSTSSVSSSDGCLSESLSSSVVSHHSSEERKVVRQNASRSSIGTGPFSGGPKTKKKSSGLRMPSPKIGFFDEESIFSASMQARLGGPSPSPNGNKLKADGQIHKEILKNKMMNSDRKTQKDDCEAGKENVISFEDQVNGLSRQLEVTDLERNGAEVKGQNEVLKHGQRSVLATATMNRNRKCVQ